MGVDQVDPLAPARTRSSSGPPSDAGATSTPSTSTTATSSRPPWSRPRAPPRHRRARPPRRASAAGRARSPSTPPDTSIGSAAIEPPARRGRARRRRGRRRLPRFGDTRVHTTRAESGPKRPCNICRGERQWGDAEEGDRRWSCWASLLVAGCANGDPSVEVGDEAGAFDDVPHPHRTEHRGPDHRSAPHHRAPHDRATHHARSDHHPPAAAHSGAPAARQGLARGAGRQHRRSPRSASACPCSTASTPPRSTRARGTGPARPGRASSATS